MHHTHTADKAAGPKLQLSLLGLGALLAFTTSAGETFLSSPTLADLEDGDVVLAGEQRSGTALHMSLMSPSLLVTDDPAANGPAISTDTIPDVYLSLRLSW